MGTPCPIQKNIYPQPRWAPTPSENMNFYGLEERALLGGQWHRMGNIYTHKTSDGKNSLLAAESNNSARLAASYLV